MKTSLFLFIGLSLLVTTFSFCSKDNDDDDSPKTLTNTEILVKNTWQLNEVLVNKNGVNGHYIRGGINTTGINYDVVRYTFKTDGTATYTTNLGQTFPGTWRFTSANEQNMEFKVGNPTVETYMWNMVQISEDAFYQTTPLVTSTNTVLLTARLVPLP